MSRSMKPSLPPLSDEHIAKLEKENRELRSVNSNHIQWKEKYETLKETSRLEISNLKTENELLKQRIFDFEQADREQSPDFAPMQKMIDELTNKLSETDEQMKKYQAANDTLTSETQNLVLKVETLEGLSSQTQLDDLKRQIDESIFLIQERDQKIEQLNSKYILLLQNDPIAIEAGIAEMSETLEAEQKASKEASQQVQAELENLRTLITTKEASLNELSEQMSNKDSQLQLEQQKAQRADSLMSKLGRIFKICEEKGFVQ